MNKFLKAHNSSGGFHDDLFEMLKEYGVGESCCLIAESPKTEPLFREWFPNTKFEYLGNGKKNYVLDLNTPIKIEKQCDSVFSQALLEHVCNPMMAIQNMANLCNVGGTIVIHTVGPGFKIHRFPVDCVRFLPDFWTEMCRYIDIELLDYHLHAKNRKHIFVAYRKIQK